MLKTLNAHFFTTNRKSILFPFDKFFEESSGSAALERHFSRELK